MTVSKSTMNRNEFAAGFVCSKEGPRLQLWNRKFVGVYPVSKGKWRYAIEVGIRDIKYSEQHFDSPEEAIEGLADKLGI